MPGTPHSEEVKGAVMAALLDGQSVRKVAKEYKIPEGTVKGWRQSLGGEAKAALGGKRSERIGDLVLANLEGMLRATTEMIRVVSEDEDWLKKQSASELAVLIGVISDKAHRILSELPEPVAEADDVP